MAVKHDLITKANVRDFAAKVLLHSGCLLVAYCIAWMVVRPVQHYFLQLLSTFGVIFYMPFGIKLVSAYFEGWRSMIYLAPGVILANLLFINLPFNQLSSAMMLTVSYATAPAMFALLAYRDSAEPRYGMSPRDDWRRLLIGGMLTTFIVSTTVNVMYFSHLSAYMTVVSMFRLMVGDILGLLATLFVLTMSFRVAQKVMQE